MITEIPLGMSVGSCFRPEHAMVTFAEGTQQAGQSDDGEIQPTETLAIGGMPKLMHTNLVTENKPFSFALHPRACPKVDESAQRYAHAIFVVLFRHKGDAAKSIDTVSLTDHSSPYRIKPTRKGLRQLPGKSGKQLPEASHKRAFGIGKEKASADLCHEMKPMEKG